MNFPSVGFDARETWIGNDNVVVEAGSRIGTVFKTFIYKAEITPAHTPFEWKDMEDLYAAFERHGLKVKEKALKREFEKLPNGVNIVNI